MVWGRSQDPWSWYFRETNRRYPHSYQVWRPEFDALLLDNSRRHGVEVCEGHRVTEVVFDGGRASAVRMEGPDGSERTESADFVVDASGQAALIGRARQLAPLGSVFPQHGGVRVLRGRGSSRPP